MEFKNCIETHLVLLSIHSHSRPFKSCTHATLLQHVGLYTKTSVLLYPGPNFSLPGDVSFLSLRKKEFHQTFNRAQNILIPENVICEDNMFKRNGINSVGRRTVCCSSMSSSRIIFKGELIITGPTGKISCEHIYSNQLTS